MPLRPALPAAAALLAVLLAAPGLPVQSQPQVPCADPGGCPDLFTNPKQMLQNDVVTRTFGPSSCAVQEGSTQQGERRLLRFSFLTPNLGPGDLVIGRPTDHPDWFTWGACHRHWHFNEYADYRLWEADAYPAWLELRARHPDAMPSQLLAANPGVASGFIAGNKQGFCVIDVQPLTGVGIIVPSKYHSCSNNQGISVGWADQYHKELDGQWIDVTDVPPGAYVLEAEVNPERMYAEKDYANNWASLPIVLG